MIVHPEMYRMGSRVRVTTGSLSGLVGVVVKVTKSGNYRLNIDGCSNGAYLVIGGDALALNIETDDDSESP